MSCSILFDKLIAGTCSDALRGYSSENGHSNLPLKHQKPSLGYSVIKNFCVKYTTNTVGDYRHTLRVSAIIFRTSNVIGKYGIECHSLKKVYFRILNKAGCKLPQFLDAGM